MKNTLGTLFSSFGVSLNRQTKIKCQQIKTGRNHVRMLLLSLEQGEL